jgi:dUTP pyrophosphatase
MTGMLNMDCMTPTLKILRLPHAADVPLPSYQTAGAAGLDLMAALQKPVILACRERAAIPTGLILEIPEGFEGQVRPRSGLALKFGVTCLNTPGTIDWDYRGELKVILINHGHEPFEISHGMRIAQIVIAPVTRMAIEEINAVSQTERGTGGFGSTGTG